MDGLPSILRRLITMHAGPMAHHHSAPAGYNAVSRAQRPEEKKKKKKQEKTNVSGHKVIGTLLFGGILILERVYILGYILG